MMLETISSDLLLSATGGQQGAPQPQTPPPNITRRDVAETTLRATQAVLRPTSLLGNLGQAYRQFNDPRVGTGFTDRLAYGFTGLFGIDPLKP